jgi:hypothetical protein
MILQKLTVRTEADVSGATVSWGCDVSLDPPRTVALDSDSRFCHRVKDAGAFSLPSLSKLESGMTWRHLTCPTLAGTMAAKGNQ